MGKVASFSPEGICPGPAGNAGPGCDGDATREKNVIIAILRHPDQKYSGEIKINLGKCLCPRNTVLCDRYNKMMAESDDDRSS